MLKFLILPLFLVLLSCSGDGGKVKKIRKKDLVVVSVEPLKKVKIRFFHEAKGSFEALISSKRAIG